jgi:hypothetical protein
MNFPNASHFVAFIRCGFPIEGTGEVLERYWRGTGEVQERYWRGTGEIQNYSAEHYSYQTGLSPNT